MWISLPNWSFFADIVDFKLFGEKEIRVAPNEVFSTLIINNYVIHLHYTITSDNYVTPLIKKFHFSEKKRNLHKL